MEISFLEGIGAGILMPRTNTTLLKNPRYDQFYYLLYYSFLGLALPKK